MPYSVDIGGPPRFGMDCGNQIAYHLTKLGDKLYVLEECQNFQEGLSKREKLNEQEGMIFNFNNKDPKVFHMKDCLLPLDIVFIKNNMVEKICHECNPCKDDDCTKYEHPDADIVIELLGGTCKKDNISEGLAYKVITE